MGKIESTLRSEIARLSRREAKAMLAKTVKDVRQLRKRVVALQRELRDVKSARASEQARAKVAAVAVPVSAGTGGNSRLSPGLIRTLRRRLKISQAELAKLVGVSTVTVGLWEAGRTRPRDETKVRIVALRGLKRREVERLLDGSAG